MYPTPSPRIKATRLRPPMFSKATGGRVRRSARRWTTLAAALSLGAGLLAGISAAAPAGAAAPTLNVDLGTSTGAFYGGANGALYALAEDGVASDDTVAPLHMRTIAQKPDNGAQHPTGDVDNVAPEFFRTGGSRLFIYMQDAFTYFPYENPGLTSYQQTVATIVGQVNASPYKSSMVFVPFNEPDNIWYDLHSGDSSYAMSSAQFFQDWKTIYTQIRQADPGALIAGPNTSSYDGTFMHDFLSFAKANSVLPDVMTWHELGDGLYNYRSRYASYRSLEQTLAVNAIPIDIDEYAPASAQGNPGEMLPWLALFEDTKVDAMQAYWNITENVQGNVAKDNQADGAWWLMRWYGALTGNTVKVSPPSPNTDGTVQAIATLDSSKKQARVLIGGGSGATTLTVSNVPSSVFGSSVHAEVQRTSYSGYESAAPVPTTIAEGNYSVSGGGISIPLPTRGAMDAYQVILTPGASFGSDNGAQLPTTVRYEAENAAITDATVYPQGGDAISNGNNVGSINKSDSRLTFTVNAPQNGRYHLDIYYGNQDEQISQQIMQIDGGGWQFITYPPTLNWNYNAYKRIDLALTAGTHTITFGVSDPSIGTAVGEVTMDAIDLTPVTTATTDVPENAQRYEAEYGDLSGATTVSTTSGGYSDSGYVHSAPTASAKAATTLVVAAGADGYYDLSLRYRSATATSAAVSWNVAGQVTPAVSLPGTGGAWAEYTRLVWLKAGINRVQLAQAAGAVSTDFDHLDVTPTIGAISAATTYQAENAALSGTSTVGSSATAANGSYVGNVGNGSGNTVTFSVNAPQAGTYAVAVSYADDERPNSNHYNTDLIDRYADVAVANGGATRATQRVYFRNTYSWSQWDTQTFYVSLAAGANTLTFGNTAAFAPDLDQITTAPLIANTATLQAETATNTLAGTAAVTNNAFASGGQYVGYIGNGSGNTLTFKGISASATGTGTVLLRYATGETRTAAISVNGGAPTTITFPSTASFSAWDDIVLRVPLNAGSNNTLAISNSSAYAPDIDKLVVIG